MAWLYREHVLAAASFLGNLDSEEAGALSETSYTVDREGKIHSQPRFISLLAMFRVTTRIAQRLNPDLVVKFSDRGWQAVRDASTIRNRITHPKRARDLELTAADASRCLEGFFWMLETILSAMEASNQAMQKQNHRFRDILEDLNRGDPETLALYNWLKDRSD
jgi:hypothetical protein